MRVLYSLLWHVVLPLALFKLWWRGRKEPAYRQHIAERFGFYRQFSVSVSARPLWLHAVSVGETRAAQPLIEALLARYPERSLLLTHMTATGRVTGQQLFAQHGARVQQCYLPYDTGWMAARFLRHFKPCVSLLMETEVWPNMVAQCVRHQVPVALLNARLSERSLRRGQRFERLMREAAAGLALVAAQSAADAARLQRFGARSVHVTGSLKFDVTPPPTMLQRGAQWRAAIGSRAVLLCASTREGEEQLILAALAKAADVGDLLLVMVPRHPQRFDAVADLITAQGFSMQRRSALHDVVSTVPASVRVWLGDSMGEMFAYYAACDVAFIGGSLLPLGGQNLIEAALLGKPILSGPHTFNFAQSTDDAIADGAAWRVADADALLHSAVTLLHDPIQRQAMAQAGQAFALQHQGATTRSMALLAPLLQCQAESTAVTSC